MLPYQDYILLENGELCLPLFLGKAQHPVGALEEVFLIYSKQRKKDFSLK